MANYNKMVNGKIIALTDTEQATREAEEKAWADATPTRRMTELRKQRNALLAETDWMANSDITMSDDWKTYRQALRDITKTYKSMRDVGFSFPKKPS